MGIKIYNETTCERCGLVNKEEDKGGDDICPPVGWAELTLTFHVAGIDWPNKYRHNYVLCPECAAKVREDIESK